MKREEAHIFADEEMFRHTFDNLLEGVQIHDFNWRYTYVNNALVKNSHYTKDELIGYTLMDKYPGIEHSDLFKVLEKCMNERVSKQFETEFTFPNGSKEDFELSIQPIPEGIFILSINISQRKRAEEKQKASETYYHSVIEQASDTIYIVDGSIRPKFIDINKSGCELLGYSKEEILQLTTFDIIFEDDFASSKARIEELKNGMPLRKERRLKRKDGSVIYAELSAKKMDDGNIMVVVRDISERKKAEEQLAANEKRFRALVENNYDIISLIDENFNVVYRSPSSVRIMGWTLEEMPNVNDYSNIHPEDREYVSSIIQEAKNSPGRPIHASFRRQHKNGHYVWLEGVITNLLHDEHVKAYVSNFRDITERKKIEHDLKLLNETLENRVNERTHELEAFSYSVSHDLRAPLRAVNGYAQMLIEDYAPLINEEGNRIIHNIKYNASKMGALIDDLLAFSRLGRKELQKREIDLNEMLEGVLIELNKTTTHHAKIKIGKLHHVKADYGLLYQAIFNLVSNAIKYSSKKTNPSVNISSKEKNGEVTICIKDNGVGFDMKYVGKLFCVFQRLHSQQEFEGTGVGLAIVQRVIAKHYGKVWAKGKVNEGAEFYISLKND
ncbi:MAG: PAS domain S-box protein [Bacteroidetes bacterium]|nr:PAS domain S-box protein [Bacteroidota bacterium]